MPYHRDTIAAIATAPGHGGIAILRVSGSDAQKVLARLFRPGQEPFLPDAPWRDFLPRHMHYGHAYAPNGTLLDEVLAVFMPGPHSVTGEDVGEIHCHGGPGVTVALLESALAAGARLAGAGEFTRRAFLNGRIDLTRAEAVNELVLAPSREGARLAAAKLGGELGKRVDAVRESLLTLRMRLALEVDFPDEDASQLTPELFAAVVSSARSAVVSLLGAYERAKFWREGALAVLAGRVNVGKSSLLNALLGRDRAIVSDAPGTTRDYIEECVDLGGLPVRVTDTAGLRLGGDLVEKEGIRRSRSLADSADILLFVLDCRELEHGLQEEEQDFLLKRADFARQGRLLLVLNKVDTLGPDSGGALPPGAGIAGADAFLPPSTPVFGVSAKYGTGIDALGQGMRAALLGAGQAAGDLAPNLRQSALLRTALAEFEGLEAAFGAGEPMDLLGFRLDAAVDALAGVSGKVGSGALLDSIFEKFCIGK